MDSTAVKLDSADADSLLKVRLKYYTTLNPPKYRQNRHRPFEHVVEDFTDVVSSEALTLHLLIVVHLTLTHLAVVKLVPLRQLVRRTAQKVRTQPAT